MPRHGYIRPVSTLTDRLRQNLGSVIKGKPREIDFLIISLVSGGNVLLTDVPGVGKTTLAKTVAASISATFRRIQFTPDLLPADVIGTQIYNPRTGEFSVKKGPVFGKISRNLLGVALSNVGYGYYFYLMVTWLPSYLVNARHLPLKTAGAFALIPYLTFAIGEPLGGLLADRLIARGWSELKARKTVITAAYLTSSMLLPAGLVGDTNRAVWFLGGASLVGLATANMYALVQWASAGGEVGFATGVFNLAGNIPGVVAPVVTGMIVERTGSYVPAFVVAVAVLMAVVPLYWTMVRE